MTRRAAGARTDRRVVNNPEPSFTPTAASMFAWYRETMSVSQWTDLTAGARHATQAVAGNQPVYTASDADFNGQPSLTFTTDDYMNCGGVASALTTTNAW